MKGYVALTAILVIIPLLLLTGVNSLYENITTLSVSKMNYDSQILKINAETCLEETVYMIKRNPIFIGAFQITQANWSCNVDIQNKIGFNGIKILNIVATDINSAKVSLKRELNTNTNPFELSNLQ